MDNSNKKLEKYFDSSKIEEARVNGGISSEALDNDAEEELLKMYKRITGREADSEVKEKSKKIIKEEREKYYDDSTAPVAELNTEVDEDGMTVYDYIRQMDDNGDYDEKSLKDFFAKAEKKKTGIRIAEGGLEAYLILGYDERTKDVHTEEEVNTLVLESGITNGLLQGEIDRMLLGHIYNEEVLIAKGKPAVDGQNGHFDFKFNVANSKTPMERFNGSIDYKSIYNFEFVNEGDLLCEYIPATNGSYGVTVTGQLIKPVQGREIPPLKGRGFVIKDDVYYYAEIKGMVELRDENYLFVDNVLDIPENVDYSTGNINFDGDVIVHGNVMAGFSINATGNVVVEGVVEAAEISTARDIVLKSGMMGGGTGKLNAGGTIMGRFFERTTINCEEDVFGDYFLNCEVSTNGVLMAHGKEYTGIIGGTVRALLGIETDVIGNEIEIKTTVKVGVDSAMVHEHSNITKQINSEAELIKNLDQKINLIKNNPAKAETCLKLLKTRIKADKMKNELMEELFEIKKNMASAAKAAIGVSGIVYPRTTLEINGQARLVKEQMRKVLIVLEEGQVEYYKYTEDYVIRNLKNQENQERFESMKVFL